MPLDPADTQPIRVMIIDDHEVSRAAHRALLQTEGLDVVADVPAGEHAVAVAAEVSPHIAIIDLGRGQRVALQIARELRALPHAPTIALTSSSAQSTPDRHLDGFAFIAKADVCAEQLLRHLA